MATAFVLSAGGSLAAAQVGMLRALLEAGITPDLIVGSSAGAINAVAFAQNPTKEGLAQLEHIWSGLRRSTVFPINALDIIGGLAGRRDGLVSPRRLRALLARGLDIELLEDTPLPVHVVATDAATGDPVILSHGPVLDALLASSAIPGIFPPVSLDERLLTDGGIAAGTPVLQAEALGATEVYVLPVVMPEPETARGAVAFLARAFSQVFGHAAATDLSGAAGQIHLLPAPRQAITNPFDFRHTPLLMHHGYAATRAALTKLVTTDQITKAARYMAPGKGGLATPAAPVPTYATSW